MIRLASPLLLLLAGLAGASAFGQSTSAPIVGASVPCANGSAAGFACDNVDLLAFLPISGLGGATVRIDTIDVRVRLNDIWGWTDAATGREYALVGRSDGTAFVDISDPVNPLFLGVLPSHGLSTSSGKGSAGAGLLHEEEGVSLWRDIKVYADHAFVVSEAPGHGMQVFDLRQLRDFSAPPTTFTETAWYDGIGSAHNVAINEESGFAFAVGSRKSGGICNVALHMIDISTPASPRFAGCFADLTTGRNGSGYTHDAHCVNYRGPDERYQGREICIGSNETAISIADVTDKQSPVAISTGSYPTAAYVHQGWLTDDHRYFLEGDELDENRQGFNTRTIIWDLTDLMEPTIITEFIGTTQAIDHNMYVIGSFVFQANYKAGLRILDIGDILKPREIAYFDTYPAADNRGFEGAWSNYPFFPSGTVVVSSINEGLFVLKPGPPVTVGAEAPDIPLGFALAAEPYPNPFTHDLSLALDLSALQQLDVTVYDVLGRAVRKLHEGMLPAGRRTFVLDGSGLTAGIYFVRVSGPSGSITRSVILLR